jgi:methylmalonyl-CoA mutase cobalamin-binding domain/chain
MVIEAGAATVGLSILLTTREIDALPRTVALLHERRITNVFVVVVGGWVSTERLESVKHLGVSAVFTPRRSRSTRP